VTLWQHQHTIGHHVHTNDPDRDPDVNNAPQVLRFSGKLPHSKAHVLLRHKLWNVFLWSMGNSMNKVLYRDHLQTLAGWYNGNVPLVFSSRRHKILHVLGRVLMSLFHIWPYFAFVDWSRGARFSPTSPTWLWSLAKANFFAWYPSMMFHVLFIANASINHVVEANAEEASDALETDWFKAQVLHSSSHTAQSVAWLSLSGGLNLQIEHHLFPGFSHVHLRHMQPKIREICEKHRVRYTYFETIWDALDAHFDFVRRLADPEFRPDPDAKPTKDAAATEVSGLAQRAELNGLPDLAVRIRKAGETKKLK